MLEARPIQPTASEAATAVERAEALGSLIAEHAGSAEIEGRIPKPVFEALKSAGLFLITAPMRSGGEGEGVRTYVETVTAIARHCPGSAWAYGILTAATGLSASLPEPQRRLLFRRGDELSCFVGSKTGVATPTAGGYLVSGQWPYGSGCLHADWALCGVVIHDSTGEPVDAGYAYLDITGENVEILKDWNVAGLSASGSNRVKADGHLVPAELILRDADLMDMAAYVGGMSREPRDFWPVEPQFGLTVIPAMLGAAEGMLEAVRQKMNSRAIIGWNYQRQSDSQLLLAMLGEAAMKIASARMHVLGASDQMDLSGPERALSKQEKVRIQADCGYAMRLVREAAELLLDIAGPGAFALANSIQRYWRDISIGSRHNALNSGLSLELLGRALTGGQSNIQNMPEI